MGKKKRKKQRAKAQVRKTSKNSATFGSMIVALTLLIAIYVLYEAVPGYNWLFNSLVMGNLKTIVANPDLTKDQKYEIKFGFDYKYLQYVKQNTNENAIILMPPREVFLQSDFNKEGAWGAKTATWSTYFLYPRILVREEDRGIKPELYNRATHVMIVNHWGFDKLKYSVSQKQKYGVMPIHAAEDKK